MKQTKQQLSRIQTDAWGTGSLPVDTGKPKKRGMKLVLTFEGGTPGFTLCRDYRVSRTPDGSHWVLWESIEDDEATSIRCVTYCPVASVPVDVGDASQASKSMLRALWKQHAEVFDQPNSMDSFSADGLLSNPDIETILKEVWPDIELSKLCA